MTRKIVFLFLSSMLLTGCFAESMTLVSTGAGASQGRLIQSSFSSAASYGIKKTTGKFPIEHIIAREKKRIVKKTSEFETKIVKGANKQIRISKEKILPVKNIVEKQVVKLNDNLFKFKRFAVENFKHRPRFSYKTR